MKNSPLQLAIVWSRPGDVHNPAISSGQNGDALRCVVAACRGNPKAAVRAICDVPSLLRSQKSKETSQNLWPSMVLQETRPTKEFKHKCGVSLKP